MREEVPAKFHIKNDQVYWYKHLVRKADAKTFIELNNIYGKDSIHVFYRELEIEGADTQSFVALTERYGKDKNHVYYESYKIEGIDVATVELFPFQTLNKKYFQNYKDVGLEVLEKQAISLEFTDRFIRDQHNLYYTGSILSKKIKSSIAEFIGLLFNPTFFLIKDDKNIYFYNEGSETTKKISDDPEHFEVLSEEYFRDSKIVMSLNLREAIKDVDVDSFQCLGGCWGKDLNTVYYRGKKIHKSDSNFFQLINDDYAKDDYRVYFRDMIIPEADVKSFTAHGLSGKDHQHIYKKGKIIKDADPKTYIELMYGYGKDQQHVFFGFEIINEADPETFITIESGAGVDKNNVFVNGKIDNNLKSNSNFLNNSLKNYLHLEKYWFSK